MTAARPHAAMSHQVAALAMVIGLTISNTTQAQSSDTRAKIESEAIADSVWYDSDQNSVTPVDVKVRKDDSLNRSSRWLPKPDKVAKPKTPTSATSGGTGVLGSGLTIGNLLGWGLLITLFAAAIGLVLYTMSKAELDLAGNAASRRGSGQDGTIDEQMIQRMKHLPAELRRTDVNLRTEAERLMKEGLFDQAIILLFGHQLLSLDRVGMLRLNRGKTNRKYVRETRSADPHCGDQLQLTVDAFERSYFGRHVIKEDEFDALWQSNSAMENGIGVRMGAAV
ncbi:hypothetical protein Poly51_19620 [Rubripirellula tenax]|uniref:Protein-glutamine gamma-glutamyltransferase-like C-terminal domain-containing protein n=1 Tax=Rubripirellula tenax TaxID=2528015 RepID=A0A5C6FGF8_9BACT|nr:DUF4129 domain-containing protein [Rubripirellula tenax]TWU59176.1 hypothetical protein Poly51_19620 [Rubripirellula tenax]